ncbi:MAG: glutamate mutase L [Anaerolineae bacterium]|nr:glutamate mutase L [Anaerolineae bacterium]MDQ7034037.1 glutamate mutase L [Anaerolineae bacterium]
MAQAGSILTADFGSIHTRVVLVDVVDGEYRIVARERGLSTLGYPVDDVGVGLQRLINHIEEVTGRQFYDSSGQIITPEDNSRRGVDTFITTSSAGHPIRAVMVGLMPEISLTTALRAISSAYVEPVAQIHLRDGLSEEERLNALMLSRPDLIFIAGGTDDGAQTALLNILQTVQLALRITDPTLRPTIIYAGNHALTETVETMFGELTTLLRASNIRPNMEDESFESVLVELGKAYDEHRETHGNSFVSVANMTSTGILPTPQSYVAVAEYFAQVNKGDVLAVDIGSTSSILVGVFNKQTSTRISTTKGLGHSAYTLLQEVGEDTVAAWLPFYPTTGEIRDYAMNKAVRPSSLPMNLRELYLEHALLRAGLRQMMQNARNLWTEVEGVGALDPVKAIIAGGAALTNTGNAAYNMLLIADCLQPTGITEIKTDPYGLIPAMSALARLNPDAAVQLLEGDGLEHLGVLLSIDGQPTFDKVVAHLKITTSEGDSVKSELRGGHFLTLPVPHDVTLDIRITCSRGFSIGGKRRLHLKLAGGTAGIVFDARGRVFRPPTTVEDRAAQMPRWVSDATDDDAIPIPEEWLIAPTASVGDDDLLRASTPQTKATDSASALDELAVLEDDDDFLDIIGGDDDEDAPADDDDDMDLRDLLE